MTTDLTKPPWTAELYARALAGAVLPGFVWGGGDSLPGETLRLTDVRFTPGQVAAYRRVCGGGGAGLPPLMPHLPGFPLALRLMTGRDFPMSALGMVHIANSVEVRAPLEADAGYDIEVELANPSVHPRGLQFEVLTTAFCGGVRVWSEASTYLSRGTSLPGVTQTAPRPHWPTPPDDADTVDVDVPGDTGRRYAAVSGDINPIHLHPLSARLFGFRTTIVHGMWSLGRSLAEIESELPDRYAVRAGFFKPLFLPAHATLRIARSEGQWDLWLATGETVHAVTHVATTPHDRTT